MTMSHSRADVVTRFIAAAAFAALTLHAAHAARAEDVLRITSWGGSFQDAQRVTQFEPYQKKTGTKIVESNWSGELGKVRAMVESGSVTTDLIVGDLAHALTGCSEGFLQPIAWSGSFGDKSDYLPGTISDCGIPVEVVSTISAYNADRIPAAWGTARPETIADFFDIKRFPGKRAISSRTIGGIFERALMADGVPVDQIYKVLATPAGLDRAFAKLDTIKNSTVFYKSNAEPIQLLADGEVVLSEVPNGRAYNAIVKDKKNFVLVWDGQVYYPDVWFVPKGGNLEAARKFLDYVTQPEVMAGITKLIPYAPVRKSALKYVPPEVTPYLTTAHDLTRAISSDQAWWAGHEAEIDQRFQAWLAK